MYVGMVRADFARKYKHSFACILGHFEYASVSLGLALDSTLLTPAPFISGIELSP